MLVVGYLRLSTEEQAESNALEQQAMRLYNAGAKKIYLDIESRLKNDRVGLAELMKDVKTRTVGKIIVTRLDRLTASASLYEQLVELVNEFAVDLVGLDDTIDTKTVSGQVNNMITVALARGEVLRLRERVYYGIKHRRDMKKPAPGTPPFGYEIRGDRYIQNHLPALCLIETQETKTYSDLTKELFEVFFDVKKSASGTVKLMHEKYGIAKVNIPFNSTQIKLEPVILFSSVNEEKDVVDLVRKIRSQPNLSYLSKCQIGAVKFSVSGLIEMLKNPVYYGDTRYQTCTKRKKNSPEKHQVVCNTHPDQAYLTREQQRSALEILGKNKKHRGFGLLHSKAPKYALQGLVRCQECGFFYRMCTRKYRDKEYSYCYCYYPALGNCTNTKFIHCQDIESAIQEKIKERKREIAIIAASYLPQESALDPVTEKLTEQLNTLKAIDNPAVAEAINTITQQIKDRQLQSQVKNIEEIQLKDYLEAIGDDEYWESLTTSERYDIYHWLVEEVKALNGQIISVELKI